MRSHLALALPLIALAGCAGTGGARGAFDHLPLFAGGKARFALYYSCSGVNDLQNDLCDAAAEIVGEPENAIRVSDDAGQHLSGI